MKKIFFLVWIASSTLGGQEPLFTWEGAWKEVAQTLRSGQARTALKKVERLEKKARQEGESGAWVRAVVEQFTIERKIDPNRFAPLLMDFERRIEKADSRVRPLLSCYLAHLYWEFFLADPGRYTGRSGKTEEGKNPEGWSLPHLLNRIDQLFHISFLAEDRLKRSPLTALSSLVKNGNIEGRYCPTLFDLLVRDRIAFCTLSETLRGRWERERGDFAPEGTAFADSGRFMRLIPDEAPGSSPLFEALSFYKRLLKFHQSDRDLSAYAAADLERLLFCSRHARGERVRELYSAALDRFLIRWKSYPIAARASALRAEIALDKDDPATAHRIAAQGLASAPKDDPGSLQCRALIDRILAPSLQVRTESVWNGKPEIEITSKNIERLYFRLYALPGDRFITFPDWGYGNPRFWKELKRPATRSWSHSLKPDRGFKPRSEYVFPPADLTPGGYALLISDSPAFSRERDRIHFSKIQVSNLALAVTERGGFERGTLFEARSGKPIGGGEVELWRREGRGDTGLRKIGSLKTDLHGQFAPSIKSSGTYLRAVHNGEGLWSTRSWYPGRSSPRETPPSTSYLLFTDRPVYRPGQTLRFAGVSFLADSKASIWKAVKQISIPVSLYQAGLRTPLESIKVDGEESGVFSGSFTLPPDLNTGMFRIRAGDRQLHFRVEEYHRPAFEVTLNPPGTLAYAGDTVTLTGRASTYTGLPLTGGKVSWSVLREPRLPLARFGLEWPGNLSPRKIAEGESRVTAEGDFSLSFRAEPEREIPRRIHPVFTYRITAHVTDRSGETHTANRNLTLGYTAWQAAIDTPPLAFGKDHRVIRVLVRTVENAPVSAEGEIEVFSLIPPETIERQKFPKRLRLEEKMRGVERTLAGWREGKRVECRSLVSGTNGVATLHLDLEPGAYRLRFRGEDPSGEILSVDRNLIVADPVSPRFTLPLPDLLSIERRSLKPGERLRALWATGYGECFMRAEILRDGIPLQVQRNAPGKNCHLIEFPITESMRGGITLRTLFVKENRIYVNEQIIDIPWSNRELVTRWEHFTSRLTPDTRVEWRAKVRPSRGLSPLPCYWIATLYDRSLEQIQPGNWPDTPLSSLLRRESPYSLRTLFFNREVNCYAQSHPRRERRVAPEWSYPSWIGVFPFAAGHPRYWAAPAGNRAMGPRMKAAPMMVQEADIPAESPEMGVQDSLSAAEEKEEPQVPIRRNLKETAFFVAGERGTDEGDFTFTFQAPEALTGWQFKAFVFDRSLRSGTLAGSCITARDLMVQPQLPRFVYEEDEIALSFRISNPTRSVQRGRVSLNLTALPGRSLLPLKRESQPFELAPGTSLPVSWSLKIPADLQALTYRIAAQSERFSDGEEGILPVLPRKRVFLSSLRLPLQHGGEQNLLFKPLAESGNSPTLRQGSLTLQIITRPVWAALWALPILGEGGEDTESLFLRFYARETALHLFEREPLLRREIGRRVHAPLSPLHSQAPHQNILLKNTPWVQAAEEGRASRERLLALLREERPRLKSERELNKLGQALLPSGEWPWFPGGPPNPTVTLRILSGLGQLHSLGALKEWPAFTGKVIRKLDRRILEFSRFKGGPPTPWQIFSLYTRSFYLEDFPPVPEAGQRLDLLRQAVKKELFNLPLLSQVQAGIALARWGERKSVERLRDSFTQYAVRNRELGTSWPCAEADGSWMTDVIALQSLMITFFSETAPDPGLVREARRWLLNRKESCGWNHQRATADAVTALVLRGEPELSGRGGMVLTLGEQRIEISPEEIGAGYVERSFSPGEISPSMGRITLKKSGKGLSWGCLYWRFLENGEKLPEQEQGPLTLTRRYFLRKRGEGGERLIPLPDRVERGDEVVVSLELKTDRDLDFVHLRDPRPACSEPTENRSGYRHLGGVDFYLSPRDRATHLYFDRLPRGTHSLEYSCRIQQRGRFSGEPAEIQCLYAPSFGSFSKSTWINVFK